MPWKHALRDALLVLATGGLWGMDAALRGTGGSIATAVGVAAGLAAAGCGYLIHEWGHLLGARVAGAPVAPARSARAVFLFRFDVGAGTRAQFLAMSLGGFAATAAVVGAFLAWMPRDTVAGGVALTATAAGVLATAVLELPPFWRVLRGGPLPRGAAFVAGTGAGAGRDGDHPPNPEPPTPSPGEGERTARPQSPAPAGARAGGT